MEPLSIVASLLAVLEATAGVTKKTISLYRNVRDAPEELGQLSTRVSQTRLRLALQLQSYQSLNKCSLKPLIPDGALPTFHTDLKRAQTCLDSIEGILSAQDGHSKGKQYLKWVMQDKRKVTKVLRNLHDIDENLSAMLTILSLAVSLHSNELVNNLDTRHLSVAAPLQSSHHDTGTISAYPLLPMVVVQSSPHVPAVFEESIARTSVIVGQQRNELRSISWMIAFLRLPNILSSYAICVTIQLWLFKLSWPCLKHALAVKRIIPRDSSFVRACAAGDVNGVKQLALSGQGMPSDIDQSGKPMLHYAIRSGSLDLVRFLLHSGATPDDLDTRFHVSPLQKACKYGYLEIARLLLAKGAFLGHADSDGGTAITWLWIHLSSHSLRADFLKILLAHSPMRGVLDPYGPSSPFLYAARVGSVEDLEMLTGACMCMNDTSMVGKMLIKYSIFGSNLATYNYLVPLLPPEWINEVDDSGRGPLHIALEYHFGHNGREVVKRLLDAGADIHLRDINDKSPGDVACIYDAEARSGGMFEPGASGHVGIYFDALIASGFDVELDGDDTLWWPSRDQMVAAS
ncbi:MAG: hypothetical protein Q9186_006660 [Xanthomendoza sp. 1 TL-2023]